MYQVKRISHSEFVPIRNLQYHVQVWGEPSPDKTPLVIVHGWMDVAASYQFVVDALSHEHYVIAPDWRGYGLTPSGGVDNFWFPDYLADLEFLLDHYAPNSQVDLVGHSMGGNVAMLYAGVRPERIRRLVNLEGFGLPATTPVEAPGRYAHWMDDLKKLHRGEMALKAYDTLDGVARRLMKTNPRLGADKANWLAQHWAQQNAQGQWAILGDPAHKVSHAQLYRVEEVQAIYARISMPVLMVEASDDSMGQWWKGKFTLAEHHERLKVVPQLEIARIEDAGHMLHHDQPQALAELIERFL
ncbi:MAG: alpha/beta hydrolase [Gammaproteobacteria bacterium]|uniref:alpha/beta fold hydrolase n=1 Tax=Rhodoferax sp. TaxID=50421 RepID=UPI00185054D9|nr:alpha/beta hydrolase [Rhodoferax sp.]MBU3898922.1 alpha/beta hydrolase [Gammaproteobacteria bacterium]MBA3059269.1 alpha/beta hydrolase [Rhodoferax sp.]MBU3997529.1 alpha/beta hydrolase [Gammaproteobacteria bacterium]MBU4018365.1 alpha/beta hydrolase [Gammaproteobacteria bacterium]MBU4080378.1 alpha/beta hydrolase [Gammaproteobacteria bacterium]